MTPVEVAQGEGPVILGLPHTGTAVPAEIFARLNETGRALADTDWHVDRLYDGLLPGATTVRARFHRYVIDANRGPDDASLYPGQNTTGLCPVTDFDGRPIWREGEEPTAEEVAERTAAFHAPYHAALAAEIERVRARHGVAILYDCHSIRSVIPFLFEGTLPDFNVGTADGASCAPAVESLVMSGVRGATGAYLGRERAVQGRVDDAGLRAAGGGGARGADGAGAGDLPRRGGAALDLGRREGGGDAGAPPRHPRDAGARGCRPEGGFMSDGASAARRNVRDVHPPTGPEISAEELADRGADADADEQPRVRTWRRTRTSWWSMAGSGGRRGPGRTSTGSSRR